MTRAGTYPVRVTVGMPVYNGEEYLEIALDSLLKQDLDDFELLISDNASTDRTAEICQDYASRDPRIAYQRLAENRGAAFNFNRLFHQSRGEFFKWAAHDDVCQPTLIRRCLEEFSNSDDQVVLVYARSHLINARGETIGSDSVCLDTRDSLPHRRLAETLKRVALATPVFGLIRSSALKKTHLIGNFLSSDLVLLAELSMLGTVHEIPEYLIQRRRHSKSSREANQTKEELMEWFDTGNSKEVMNEQRRLGIEYLRSISRSPLGTLDRLRCYLVAWRMLIVQLIRGRTFLMRKRISSLLQKERKYTQSPEERK